jgi:hypothetical protein
MAFPVINKFECSGVVFYLTNPGLRIKNRGINGDVSAGILNRVKSITAL